MKLLTWLAAVVVVSFILFISRIILNRIMDKAATKQHVFTSTSPAMCEQMHQDIRREGGLCPVCDLGDLEDPTYYHA